MFLCILPFEENRIYGIYALAVLLAFNCPVATSQSRKVLSAEPDATKFLSGEMARVETKEEWASNGAFSCLIPEYKSRTVLSPEPNATKDPSGERAMVLTTSEWPLSVVLTCPEDMYQSRMIPSSEPDAMRDPSCENASADVRGMALKLDLDLPCRHIPQPEAIILCG